jgi:Flp pilus assembly pilin Flp
MAIMKSPHLESRKAWQRLANRFWQDERGQSTTEYILILSVVVMIAMKFKTMFNKQMESAVSKLGQDINGVMDESGN